MRGSIGISLRAAFIAALGVVVLGASATLSPQPATASPAVPAAAPSTVADPTGADPTVADPSTASRTVTYHGYRLDVPRSWRIVDLQRTSNACIRFDTPTLYLGRPSSQPDCPAGLVGRTAGIVVQPLDAAAAKNLTSDIRTTSPGSAAMPADVRSTGDTIQFVVEDAGVVITAAHTPETESYVRQILTQARLAPGAQPARLPIAPPTPRAAIVAPGNFTGKGFDACTAPSQSAMNAWLANSPYRAVGVYIGGAVRACAQPNLTATWVSTQASKGWHVMPIYVGLQAPCTNFRSRLSSNPTTARAQGHQAGADAVTLAKALGLSPGSAIYEDMEAYPRGGSCTTAVLSFLAGWTDELHARGYLSGIYSSAASGVTDLVSAYNSTTYTRPDHIFFAWWNGQANVNGGSYIPASYWANRQRIHQYVGNVTETYGGVRINIDRDYFDIGTGSPPPPPPPRSCSTVNLNFTSYRTIRSGSTGPAVLAAECLLKAAGFNPGTPNSTFGPATVAAVKAFQQSRRLTANGIVDRRTWTALLSVGSRPTLRTGSTGAAVQRLQRALTAALGRTVVIDGSFGAQTERAVRDYQTSRRLVVDGWVGAQTWSALQAGR
ncbi:glycoside hydrolase domain-containing protein [Actinopolymorpha alba]|uniref:glycoside hydrolase domain-containing protein n=1 Tax=Actinopolymorpha alba TaxID=533267 RepID=UPI0003625F1C|nr:glycoside hydrolase domain-containing protein [Actinopolymorpha alba]